MSKKVVLQRSPVAVGAVLATMVVLMGGCVGQPTVIEATFPEELIDERQNLIGWSLTGDRFDEVSHADLHWGMQPDRLDQRTNATIRGYGEYEEYECPEGKDCEVFGVRYSVRLAPPVASGPLYYQAHMELGDLTVASRVVKAEIVPPPEPDGSAS